MSLLLRFRPAASRPAVGLPVTGQIAGEVVDPPVTGRSGIEYDFATYANGQLSFRGWLVIGAPEPEDETRTIHATLYDSANQIIEGGDIDLGTIVVPAGVSQRKYEFHGAQALPAGRTYGLVVSCYEPGVVINNQDGTQSPMINCSSGRTIVAE
jgi:hypothetical protein